MIHPAQGPHPAALSLAPEPKRPSAKVMQTFRMPRDLVEFLRAEATRGGRDLTAHVVRSLEAMRSYFGLPEAATALLEEDRKALEMERFEYLLHVLFQRTLELRAKGAGYDAPPARPPGAGATGPSSRP
jgi:hypothetical protein